MKLTRWFPDYIKPVRSGVYSVRTSSGHLRYAKYSCELGLWGYFEPTKKQAHARSVCKDAYQYKPWRGLAYDPGAAK